MPLLLTSQPVDVVYTINNSPNPNLFFWSRISQLFALEFGDLMALVATHLSLLPPDPPESCQLDPLAGRDLLLWLSGTERHPADHQTWWILNLAPQIWRTWLLGRSVSLPGQVPPNGGSSAIFTATCLPGPAIVSPTSTPLESGLQSGRSVFVTWMTSTFSGFGMPASLEIVAVQKLCIHV